MDKLILQPGQIRLRHIKLGKSTDTGAVPVLGQWFTPQDRTDINSRRNRFGGGSSYTRREGLEGEATLVFPNTAANRARFLILTNRLAYEPGDEWIEIYDSADGDAAGDPLLVVTPTGAQLTRSTITISGADGLWHLKSQRETDAGFWCHAPRDVAEYYTRAWVPIVADDFLPTGRMTFSTVSVQTTADGVWTYFRAGEDATYPGNIKIDGTGLGYITGNPTLPDGPTAHWRIEATVTQIAAAAGTVELHAKGAGGADNAYLSVGANGVLLPFQIEAALSDSAHYAQQLTSATRFMDQLSGAPLSFPLTMAIERRGRWYFFYVNGGLILLAPCGTGSGTVTPELVGDSGTIFVDNVIARSSQSLLQRAGIGGDLRLPGAMPSGGLQGQYFDDHDLVALDPGNAWRRALDPTRDKQGSKAMVARRLEPTLSFANAAAFNVPIANSEYFSARYTGSIYLDLDNFDYAFRTTADDRARVWIGKTRLGEQIIDDWQGGHVATAVASTWLKAGSSSGSGPSGTSGPLNGQASGWYPIVIEYGAGTSTNSFVFEQERSNAVGTWAVPASAVLSPYGIVNSQVRGDSHYEQLLALKTSWGYQFTCAPKTLESGEFPGRLIPVVREGRDTDLVIDGFEGLNPQTNITAEDTIAALRCDAQGIADPRSTSQLTREAIDFTQIGKHFTVRSDYESLSDITYSPLLEQRARSLLGLRGAPFEEIQVQPSGRRGLTDSFPLTGTLAKMNWLPGDGARLRIPELLIDDATPRAMVEIQWPIRPQGRGRPSVKWRQRTRNFEALFRKSARVALSNDRSYQGQLAIVTSGRGVNSGNPSGTDQYARVPMPTAIADIKAATLVALQIVGTWTLEINGSSTGITINAAGRYPIDRWLAKVSGQQQMYARLTGAGTTYEVALELLVAT